jgi:hypothetical protein
VLFIQLREGLRALPRLGRQQPRLRKAAVEEVGDRHDLRERLAVGEQQRHLAVGIHLQVFGRLVLAFVQLDELRREVLAGRGLDRLQPAVRDERAGTGGEVELEVHATAVGCGAVFTILSVPLKAR